jgi:glycosyltransferase involved in cell wall biosynthesis
MKALVLPFQEAYVQPLSMGLSMAGVEVITVGKWGLSLTQETASICEFQPDIIHFHWPEALIGKNTLAKNTDLKEIREALDRLKQTGSKLVWTQHNYIPHDLSHHAGKATELYQLFANYMDGCIHHSEWGNKTIRKRLGFDSDCQHITIRHGNKSEPKQSSLTQDQVRQRLGLPINKKIYLSVGVVRPYKNLELIIETLNQRDDNELLLIAGGVLDGDYYKRLVSIAKSKNKIGFLGYVEKPQLDQIMCASDYLITAHGQTSLTSAAPHLSLQYAKSMICPRTPYFLEALGESAVYYDNDSTTDLDQCLNNLTESLSQDIEYQLNAKQKLHTWKQVGLQTRDFYKQL